MERGHPALAEGWKPSFPGLFNASTRVFAVTSSERFERRWCEIHFKRGGRQLAPRYPGT